MQEVGYLEAWLVWWHGPTQNLSLWGIPMICWGRVGKIVQFMAALSILAEIIGPARIRAFGCSLRGISLRDIFRRLQGSPTPIFLAFIPAGILAALGTIWIVGRDVEEKGTAFIALRALILTVLFFPLFLLSIGLTIAVLTTLGRITDQLLRGVAWGLERPELNKVVKVISAILLLVGFHFDLLAS